jgi:hypothetical protein
LSLIKNKIFYYGFSLSASLALISLSSPIFAAAQSKNKTKSPTTEKTIEAARVISCAIRFPLDSVKFSEAQVTTCLKTAKMDSISYIHVIATASATGSGKHNLYLSTRRAGAIEAYLNNHYPTLKVHAFGGGENPRFGMMARIFIVENNGNSNSLVPGVQLASAGPPEVIERTVTKYVTKIEYTERPKRGLGLSLHSGPAKTELSNDIYNYFAVKFSKAMRLPLIGNIIFGLRHKVLQSNNVLDINSTNLLVGRDFKVTHLFGKTLIFGQTLEAGQLHTNNRSIEWGTTSTLGMHNKDYNMSIIATKSNHLATIGMGLGLRM